MQRPLLCDGLVAPRRNRPIASSADRSAAQNNLPELINTLPTLAGLNIQGAEDAEITQSQIKTPPLGTFY